MAAREYLLGVDYGDKRVGLALAHQIARIPSPFKTVANDDSLLSEVQQIIEKENIFTVVVGLPRGMDGGYTEQTRKAEAFATMLQGAVDVPVKLADETLTSVDAEAHLGGAPRNKGDIDAVAAALILERYLAEHSAEIKE